MKIEVVPFASAAIKKNIAGNNIVVIDVLRATSVIITALQNGAKNIIPVLTIDNALKVSKELPPGSFLLCGERNAGKIDGFNLGNSPLEFTREMVENKTIIITTTNGTKALNACNEAKNILIGAFLNVKAIVEKINNLGEIILLCSGTNDKFSLDDGICAAMIIDSISKNSKIQLDDLGQVLHSMYKNKHDGLYSLLQDAFHMKILLKKGFKSDVDYCLETNISSVVPVFNPITGYITSV